MHYFSAFLSEIFFSTEKQISYGRFVYFSSHQITSLSKFNSKQRKTKFRASVPSRCNFRNN